MILKAAVKSITDLVQAESEPMLVCRHSSLGCKVSKFYPKSNLIAAGKSIAVEVYLSAE